MGKKRHSRDKLYIIPSEYAAVWGGYKEWRNKLPFRCLPFYCCGLSLLPFKIPVCSRNGIVFDRDNILPYIDKYHRNPVDGSQLNAEDLINLKFHKNNSGEFHCPVTFKVFNDNTHIVANGVSGHVYTYEAIDRLCKVPKTWVDLLDGTEFSKSDIITIQNPHEVHMRMVNEFDYVQKGFGPVAEFEGIPSGEDSVPGIRDINTTITDLVSKIKSKSENQDNPLSVSQSSSESQLATSESQSSSSIMSQSSSTVSQNSAPRNSVYTTDRYAASFTSTVVEMPTDKSQIEYRELTEKEKRESVYEEIKKRKLKGYVSLETDYGTLNLQLHSDIVPMTCDNFIRHCENKYYSGTIFHRLIKRFVMQGGDPIGTGLGGESSFEYGLPFTDEFHPSLRHKGTGIVSMANSGKDSNKSQFYITFASCEHLDNKHSVFGRVVGGLEKLKQMEDLPVREKDDRPKNPPRIINTPVYKNPFKEVVELLENEKRKDEKIKAKQETDKQLPWFSHAHKFDAMHGHPARKDDSIGKYISIESLPKKVKK